MSTLKDLEVAEPGVALALDDFLTLIPFNEQGLIAAIAQDRTSKQVLMLGWMNRGAIERTLNDGFATYYSRSRQTFWRKGETSGHLQKLHSMRFDCDADSILLTVDQTGPACHTNRDSCFYLKVEAEKVIVAPAQDRA